MSTTFTTSGRFAGKNVLITGGSGGIGKATAERIDAEGPMLESFLIFGLGTIGEFSMIFFICAATANVCGTAVVPT